MSIRINNIEFKQYSSKNKGLYEIVKWYPNMHYNAQEKLKNEGYVENFEGTGFIKNNWTINNSCFKNPETCYVIAFIEEGKESWELRSVGERMIELNKQEWKDFYKVYKLRQKKLNK